MLENVAEYYSADSEKTIEYFESLNLNDQK